MITNDQLSDLRSRQNEVFKRVKNAKLNIDEAFDVIQRKDTCWNPSTFVPKPFSPATTDQLLELRSCQNSVLKQVRQGELAIEEALGEIKRMLYVVPYWWRTPDQQLTKARELWPRFKNLPGPPQCFIPQTKTEVLLLHLPIGFENLWDRVVGFTKKRNFLVEPNNFRFSLHRRVPEYTKPVWLGFDPGKNSAPKDFCSQSKLASSEAISGIIQFPDWPLTWQKSYFGPQRVGLGGYRVKYSRDERDFCLIVSFCRDTNSLETGYSGDISDYTSPSVREC